jgi:molybdate transport system substrate-binding protein
MNSTLPPRISPTRLIVALLLVIAAGCASKPEPGRAKVNRDPNLLVIYAACSLKPTLESAQAEFSARNSGKSLDLDFDEPATLAKRIESGAVPDIVVFPGEAEIRALEADGFLDGASRQAFGPMRLAIMVPKGNPAQIRQPRDLLNQRVKTIAIAIPGLTSAGTGAKRELERKKLWARLQEKLSFKPTPLEALRIVSNGQADAAVLFDPCLRLAVGGDIAADSVEVVSVLTSEGEREERIYAVEHRESPNRLLAQRFFSVLSDQQHAAPAPAANSSSSQRETSAQ